MPDAFDRLVAGGDVAVAEPETIDTPIADEPAADGDAFDRLVAGGDTAAPEEPVQPGAAKRFPFTGKLEPRTAEEIASEETQRQLALEGSGLPEGERPISSIPQVHQTADQKAVSEAQARDPLAQSAEENLLTKGPDPSRVGKEVRVEDAARFFGVTTENIEKWRGMEPIGAVETVTTTSGTDVGKNLPFIGPFFILQENRRFKQNSEHLKPFTEGLTLLLKEANEIASEVTNDGSSLDQARKRFVNQRVAQYQRGAKKVAAKPEAKWMTNYLDRRAELLIRTQGTGGQIVSGLAQMPAYMIEFAATGGLYSGAKSLALKALVKSGAKATVKQAAIGAAAGTLARTLVLGANFFAATDTRLLPNVARRPDGSFVITENKKNTAKVLFAEFARSFTENLGEVSGEKIGGFVFSKLAKVAPKTASVLSKLASNKTATRLGFSGILEEFGEERFTQIMQKIATDLGIDIGETDWLPDTERLMVELGVLAAAGAGGALLNKFLSRFGKDDGGPEEDLRPPEAQEVAPEAAEAPVSPEVEKPPDTPSEPVEAEPEAATPTETSPEPVSAADMTASQLFDEADRLGIDTEGLNQAELIALVDGGDLEIEQPAADFTGELDETLAAGRAALEEARVAAEPEPVAEPVVAEVAPTEAKPAAEAEPLKLRPFAQKALDRFNKRNEGRPLTGLDPADIGDMILVAAGAVDLLVRQGATLTRKAWDATMRTVLPSATKASLNEIWEASADERTRAEKVAVKQAQKAEQKELRAVARRTTAAATKEARTQAAKRRKLEGKVETLEEGKAKAKGDLKVLGGVVKRAATESRKLVALLLRQQSRAARAAFKAGAEDIVLQHEDLAAFATEQLKGVEISEGNRARLLRAVTGARTKGEKARAITAINAVVDMGRRNKIIEGVKPIQQRFNKRKGQTDFQIRPEVENFFTKFGKTATAGTVANALRRVANKLKSLGRPIPEGSPIWETIALLDAEGDVPIRGLEAQLISDVLNTIGGLVHAEATRGDFIASENHRDAKKATALANEQVTTRQNEPVKINLDKFTWWIPFGRVVDRENSNRSLQAERLAGQTGPVMDILHKDLRIAEAAEKGYHDARYKFFAESLKSDGVDITTINTGKWTKSEVRARIGGRNITILQGELAGVLGNLADSRARAKLLHPDHQGIKFASIGETRYKLSVAEAVAIEKVATKEQKAMVNAVMGWYNGPQIEQLNEVNQQLRGRDLSSRRDRYPQHMDPDFLNQEPDALIRAWTGRQAEHAGQFKPLTDSLKPVIIDDIFVAFEKDTRIAGIYVTKQIATHNANRLLRDQTFRETVKTEVTDGDKALQYFEEAVEDFHGLNRPQFSTVDKLMIGFMHNFHIAVLGLKPNIAFYQLVSYFSSLTDIPFRYWARVPVMPTKARVVELSNAHSELAARARAEAHSILSSEDLTNVQRLGTDKSILDAARDAGMAPIRWMDMFVIVNIWEASKSWGRAKGLKGEALLDWAAQKTIDVIDETQPTWGVGNTSKLALRARKNPWLKPLSLFTSQTSKYYNRGAKAILRYNHGEISFAKMVRDVSTVTFLQSAMIVAIQQSMYWVYSGFRADDDDDRDMWQKSRDFGLDTVRKVFGQWLLAREILVPVAAEIESEITGRDIPYYLDAPMLDFGKRGLQVMRDTAAAIRASASDEFLKNQEATAKWWKAVGTMQRFFSVGLGLPTQGPTTIGTRLFEGRGLKTSFDSERSKLRRQKKTAKEAGKLFDTVPNQRLAFLDSKASLIANINASIKVIEADKTLTAKAKLERQTRLQERIDTIRLEAMTVGEK